MDLLKQITGALFIALLAAAAAATQDLPGSHLLSTIKGPLKSVTYERTILVRNGQGIPPLNQRLISEVYDRDRRIIQSSVYGNVEKRVSLDYSSRPVKLTVAYFDKDGNVTTAAFRPHSNGPAESELCSRYSLREEEDKAAKIERVTEICDDGSIRTRITYEHDSENRLFREFREDAKRRTWEARYRYDGTSNEIVEAIFMINDLERPKYWQTVMYAEPRFDSRGNWTQVIASSFDSTVPNKLVYQMIEKRTIEYHPD